MNDETYSGWSNYDELVEGWYNVTPKNELIKYATDRGLDIGQNDEQLHEDWNNEVIEEKYRELGSYHQARTD